MAKKELRIQPRSYPKRDKGPGTAQPRKEKQKDKGPAPPPPLGSNPISTKKKVIPPSTTRKRSRKASGKRSTEYFMAPGKKGQHARRRREAKRRALSNLLSPWILMLFIVLAVAAGLALWFVMSEPVPQTGGSQSGGLAVGVSAKEPTGRDAPTRSAPPPAVAPQLDPDQDGELSTSLLAAEVAAGQTISARDGAPMPNQAESYQKEFEQLQASGSATPEDVETLFQEAMEEEGYTAAFGAAILRMYHRYLSETGIASENGALRARLAPHIDRLLESSPADPAILILAGDMLLQSARVKEAQKAYRQAEALDPMNPDVLKKLAFVLASTGQHDALNATLAKLIEASPSNIAAQKAYAVHLFETGDYEKAAVHLRLANTLEPDDLRMARILAITLVEKLQRYEEGKEFATQALLKFPNTSSLLLMRGLANYQIGDFAAAIPDLEDVLSISDNPENQQWYGTVNMMLGNAYKTHRDDKERALQHYLAALKTIPNPPVGLYNNIAYIWAEQNRNLDQALEYAQRAYEASPRELSHADTLGFVLYRLERYQESLEVFEKSYPLADPPNPDFLLHYGDALEKTGNPDRARAIWKEAAAAAPDHNAIQSRLNDTASPEN